MRNKKNVHQSSKRKQWRKGHSCESNPKVRKFRDDSKAHLVRAHFQHPKSSGLTLENLKLLDNDDILQADSESHSIGSAQTFLSGWSDCTNNTFRSVEKLWSHPSAHNKEVCAVLAAVADIIKQQGGKESDTEYFAALMTTLTQVGSNDQVSATLHLLTLVLKRLPRAVLMSEFSSTSKIMGSLLLQSRNSDDVNILKSVISCLASLLRAVDYATWKESYTQKLYEGLMPYTIHDRPVVRKQAQKAVCAILKGSSLALKENVHPVSVATAKFSISVLETEGVSKDPRSALHILGLLAYILPCFSQNYIKLTCECIFKLMTLNNAVMRARCLFTIQSSFSSRPSVAQLPPSLNAQILNAIYEYKPNEHDSKLLPAWIATVDAVIQNLFVSDAGLALEHLSRVVMSCISSLSCENQAVMTISSSVVTNLISNIIGSLIRNRELESFSELSKLSDPLLNIVHCLESGLHYRFYASWHLVLGWFSNLYKVCNASCWQQCIHSLKLLSNLRNSADFPYSRDVDQCFVYAIGAFGPERILEIVPLGITGINDDVAFPRSWLMGVLVKGISHTKLSFFVSYFLPLAQRLYSNSVQLLETDSKVLGKTYAILEEQIWLLLPRFCLYTTDLDTSLKTVAKTLGGLLNSRPVLRAYILAGLRNLVHKPGSEHQLETVGKFLKNFLPICFNMYINEPDRECIHKMVLATIKSLFTVTPADQLDSFYDKAIGKNDDKTAPNKENLFDIIVSLVPYIGYLKLTALLDVVESILNDKNSKLHKKAFRIIEEAIMSPKLDLENNATVGQLLLVRHTQRLLKLLMADTESSLASSMAPKLRCMSVFVNACALDKDVHTLLRITPDIVMSTQVSSMKVKQAALNLLFNIGQRILDVDDVDKSNFAEFVSLVANKLTGTKEGTIAALISMEALAVHFHNALSRSLLENLFDAVCLTLETEITEIKKRCLVTLDSLIKHNSNIFMAEHAKKLFGAMEHLNDAEKYGLRYSMRAILSKFIKRFSFPLMISISPEFYHKQLANIHKSEERKRIKKKCFGGDVSSGDNRLTAKQSQPETIDTILNSGSDSDDAEDDLKMPLCNAVKTKKFQAAWLKEEEDPVNFMDPSSSRSILSIMPKTKRITQPQKDIFETGPDGRLVITNDSSMKRKATDTDESNTDDEEVAGNVAQTGSKVSKCKDYGAEYRSKKAKGDIKLKGKPDPYAYVPLNVSSLNRRKRAKLEGQYKGLVKGVRKGVALAKRRGR